MLSRLYKYIGADRPINNPTDQQDKHPAQEELPDERKSDQDPAVTDLQPINPEEVLDQDMDDANIETQIDQLTHEFEGDSLIIDELKSTPAQYGTTFENAIDFTSSSSYKTIKFNSNTDILSNLHTSEPNEYEWKINRFYLPKLNKYYQFRPEQELLDNHGINDRYSIDEKLQEIEREKLQKVSRITPITPEQLKTIKQIFFDPNKSRVVASNYQIDLTVRDFQTLRPSKWLNDNIIDYYFNIISNQDPQYFSWTSHFYSTLKSRGYSGVQRWGKRKKLNLFEKSLIFIPINISSTHWALATIDNTAKTISYYDSLSGLSSDQSDDDEDTPRFTGLDLIKTYMKGEVGRLQLGTSVDVDSYKSLSNIKVPQQQNGFDCGVFTCVCAYYLSTKRPLTYSQKDIPTFRNRMVLELLQNKLLD